jgi:hypothetical protein
MEIQIRKITIMHFSHAADQIFIETSLPLGIWPFDGYQSFKFEVKKNNGEKYIADNFSGIEPVVLNLP